VIAAIGLAIGYGAQDGFEVILPYYGLFFLLAIPLVGLRPRTLACITAGLIVVGPLLVLGSYYLGLGPVTDTGPTFSDAVDDPIGFVLQLFVTGVFPAVVYMAYICAGLAIGRLDLSSTRVATRLLGGGLVLAVTAWVTSSVILLNLGGLQHLGGAATPGLSPAMERDDILWDPNGVASWWWLTIRGHHSNTPFDAMHTLGVAMAVLGAVLLLTKFRAARRLLWPVAVAGTMTLTIYSAQVLLLGTDLLSDNYTLLYLVTVAGALAFAILWNRFVGQGPLERLVATASNRARRRAMARLTAPHDDPDAAQNSSG
jgi:hypothetical protein